MRQGSVASLMDSVGTSGYTALVFDRLARQMCQVTGSASSSILARDCRSPGTTIVVAACGPQGDLVGSRLGIDEAIPALVPDRERRTAADCIVVRAKRKGAVFGALVAAADDGVPFRHGEPALLTELADTAAAALEHAEGREHTLRAIRTRVRRLVEIVQAHDGYTGAHSQAVVEWSCAVGARLGMSPADLVELELGALLHDLGKVRVPGSTLRKPAPLSRRENRLISRHPAWGAELLESVSGLEPVATIVRFHHERWDGRGYPHGLRGPRTPLASRIVAVCDAYDAMTSDRPYRPALSADCAVHELTAGAGAQFDPAVVTCFVDLLEEHPRASAEVVGARMAA